MTATGEATALTPSLRQAGRRARYWVGAAVLVVLLALGTAVLRGGADTGQALDPEGAAPGASGALAEVLRDHGVSVTAANTLDEARRQSTTSDTTLLIYDAFAYLDSDALTEAISLADRVVVVQPSPTEVETIAPGVASAGSPETTDAVPADCASPGAERAGSISPGGTAYRIVDDSSRAIGCFPTGDDAYSVVSVPPRGSAGTVTILGNPAVLTNEAIASEGNAALALGLLGQGDDLVWYLPGAGDASDGGTPTVADLTPDWVTPAVALLVVTTLAAMLWRGRRLGPIVIENLPVVVRASETTEGRARLYARGSARLRALDAIRIGTVSRLSARLGLASAATIDDVALAIGAILGVEPGSVHRLLIGAEPGSDAELVELSDRLLRLERDVAAALGDGASASVTPPPATDREGDS